MNAPQARNAPKILVVDDDATHLQCTKDLLEDEGYEVTVNMTAFGATEKVILQRPDLVLLDVNMPALSGEGLVRVLRGRADTKGIRLFLHSSNDEETLRRTSARLATDGWVCKGDPDELRRKVAGVLRRP